MAYDPETRNRQILGHPPRLQPVSDELIDDETMVVVNLVRDLHDLPHDGPLPEIVGVMGRNGPFFRHFFAAADLFQRQSSLPDRLRELIILRSAWLCGAPYAWSEHVAMGRAAGLSAAEIERVTQGSAAPGWTADERVLLRAVEELHADAMIADATWAALSGFLEHAQLIEVPILVGHYHLGAFVQNSLRLTPRNEDGLAAR